jgi:N-acetylneuraminic acid mutarotase
MPIPRCVAAAAAFGPVIYVLGGSGKANGEPDTNSRINQIFDPATGNWTFGPPMQTRRCLFPAVTRPGFLFAVGGYNETGPIASVEFYNPNTKVWSQFPLMNWPRAGAAAAVVGNRLYVFGGNSGNAIVADVTPLGPSSEFNLTAEYFDFNTNQWVMLPNELPMGFYGPATAVIGNKVYMYGGLTRDPDYNFSSIAFDTVTQRFEYILSPGFDRVWCAGGAVGGKAYAFGGIRYKRLQPTGSITEYAPEANAWSRVPQYSTPPRAMMACAVYEVVQPPGQVVFLFGGSTVFTNAPVYGTVEQFMPSDSTFYLLKKT